MRLTEAEYTAYLVRHGLTPEPSLRPVPTLAMDPASPEGVLANRLQAYATTAQWLFYHTYSSKRSTPGWPDVALVHPGGGPLYLWELKSATGQVSPTQRRWLDALARVTHVETGVYRPADWDTILHLLTRRDT